MILLILSQASHIDEEHTFFIRAQSNPRKQALKQPQPTTRARASEMDTVRRCLGESSIYIYTLPRAYREGHYNGRIRSGDLQFN